MKEGYIIYIIIFLSHKLSSWDVLFKKLCLWMHHLQLQPCISARLQLPRTCCSPPAGYITALSVCRPDALGQTHTTHTAMTTATHCPRPAETQVSNSGAQQRIQQQLWGFSICCSAPFSQNLDLTQEKQCMCPISIHSNELIPDISLW